MTNILLLALLLFSTHGHAHEIEAQAKYLGNEGVMVVQGDTRILFDAFFTESYAQYALVPQAIATALQEGEAPFNGVDAVFVSHVHGDHFSAAPTIAYLRAHPQVQFYASEQVRDAIRISGIDEKDPVFERIHTYDLEPGDEPLTLELEGLLIEAVAIPHSGGERMADITNFAWRVTLDDAATVIHLGDASTVPADYEQQRAFFEARKHHAAFVPYWLFLDEAGTSIVETFINADRPIGVHVPASAIGNGDRAREQVGADVFTDPGETRRIGMD